MKPARLGPSDPRLAPTIAATSRPSLGFALSLAAHGIAAGLVAWTWTTTIAPETSPIAIEVMVAPSAPIVADGAPTPDPPPSPADAAPEAPPEVAVAPASEPAAQAIAAEPPPPQASAPAVAAVAPAQEPRSITSASAASPRPRAAPSRRPPVTAAPTATDIPPPAAPPLASEAAASAPAAGATTAVAPLPIAPASNAGDVYLGRLVAWLSRHKEYPRAARETGIEGEVLVRFRIDRDGTVVERSIQRSSGHGVLDRAVIRLLERASPVPAPPESLARLEFAVPIRYGLE